ncbi:MAG TPA: hypothetical protein VD864_15630 [Nocardioides sp.]|nr:hypothetical protein [Nocardioides sp.]
MTDTVVSEHHAAPSVVRTLDVLAKAGLVILLWVAITNPEVGHLRGKGAGIRAVGYPTMAFVIPAAWWIFWRDRVSFPWVADLLVTLTCFTDTLGNRMDLYDTIRWFDDGMHLVNTGLIAAAALLLTLPRSASLGATIERALAIGVTAALAWEIGEYYAFLSTSSERIDAYADTLGDLGLGTLGVLVAALVVHRLRRGGRLRDEDPMPWTGGELARAHQ